MVDSEREKATLGSAEPGFPAPRPPATLIDLMEPDQTAPSTAEHNVARARRRRDNLSPETQLAALELLGRSIAAMSRQPFRDLLREMIGGAPTPEAIRAFADKYPDRWAQALSILGGLAGYERGIVEINVFNIKGLSDADLMRRLAETEDQVARLAGRPRRGETVDAEIVPPAAATEVPAAQPARDQLDTPPEV